MRSALVAVAVAAFVRFASCPSEARADTRPSTWDRARDPGVSSAWEAHLDIQHRLTTMDRQGRVNRADVAESLGAGLRDRVRAALQRTPRDLRLRFDLGEVLLKTARQRQDYVDAKQALEEVIGEAPEHPAADEGFWRLAEACGHLGDHACEKRAYTEVLKRWTEDKRRATPLLNLAETEMHLGNLREAVEIYRECMRVAGRVGARETSMLAQWGLAVALDRTGDHLAAMREATFAVELERSSGFARYVPHLISGVLRQPGVYFVPDYELAWYEGLGAIALAKKAPNDLVALEYWRKAEQLFGAYVRGAESDRTGLERWTAIAKNRLAVATAERGRFEKKVRANPVEAPRIEETF